MTDLKLRVTYVAVISKGKIVFEEIKNDGALTIRNNLELKKLGITKIASAAYTTGNYSNIKVNGGELSLNKRGFNIVLIKGNKDFYLLNVDSFQTNKIDTVLYKPVFKNLR